MLGDSLERALTRVGITHDRVENWLGKPCGCVERKEKLNALGAWAARVMSGKTERAHEYLARLMYGADNLSHL